MKTHPSITTLVWDVGNVLVRWTPELVYAKDPRFTPDVNKDWCDRVIRNPWGTDRYGWNADMDRGLSFAETYPQRVARFPSVFPDLVQKFPDYANLMAQYFEQFEVAMSHEVVGIKEIKQELSGRFRTLALSNFSKETWSRIAKNFPQMNDFEGKVVSGEVGLVKPDREIFHYLFNTLGVKPSEALFIDDSAANVAASEALGMRAVQFTPNWEQPHDAACTLRHNLRQYGLHI